MRTFHKLKASGDTRPIFYLDKTWMSQNLSQKDIWQDSTGKDSLKVPLDKGSRLIICHGESASMGFIPESRGFFALNHKIKIWTTIRK